MLKSLDVVEEERRPRPFGQSLDGALEVEPLDAAVAHRFRSCHDLFIQWCRRARWRASGGSSGDRDTGSSPGDRARFPPRSRREIREAFDRPEKDLLEQILRVGPGPAHPPRQVEQPRRMLPIELLESWDISSGHSPRLDEVRLERVALAPRRIGRLVDCWT